MWRGDKSSPIDMSYTRQTTFLEKVKQATGVSIGKSGHLYYDLKNAAIDIIWRTYAEKALL